MSNQIEFIQDERKEKKTVSDDAIVSALSGEMDVTPEQIVKMTQVIRSGILREITDHGHRLPTDAEGINTALAIMKDMDHTALTTSKLNIEEQKANNAANIASIADNILSKMSLGNTSVPGQIDESTIELPEIEMMEGESAQGEHSLNPDDWLQDRD